MLCQTFFGASSLGYNRFFAKIVRGGNFQRLRCCCYFVCIEQAAANGARKVRGNALFRASCGNFFVPQIGVLAKRQFFRFGCVANGAFERFFANRRASGIFGDNAVVPRVLHLVDGCDANFTAFQAYKSNFPYFRARGLFRNVTAAPRMVAVATAVAGSYRKQQNGNNKNYCKNSYQFFHYPFSFEKSTKKPRKTNICVALFLL